jgi:hypothetical protein
MSSISKKVIQTVKSNVPVPINEGVLDQNSVAIGTTANALITTEHIPVVARQSESTVNTFVNEAKINPSEVRESADVSAVLPKSPATSPAGVSPASESSGKMSNMKKTLLAGGIIAAVAAGAAGTTQAMSSKNTNGHKNEVGVASDDSTRRGI